MEVFVEFQVSCPSARGAESMLRLFRGVAENGPEFEIASIAEEFDLDSNAIGGFEALIEFYSKELACLEHVEIDGTEFRSTFVCGWAAEEFLTGLAKATAGFGAEIVKLTAKFDEGVYVCDLVDGKPHLEEFDDYETYRETGFVNLDEPSSWAEIYSAYKAIEEKERQERASKKPPITDEKFAEQERTILPIAKKFLEDTFSGVALDIDEWYSDEYRASGALQFFDTPEDIAEANKAWADENGGLENIDVYVKGQIEGLVSIDAGITWNNGKVTESNKCWIFQNGRWKLHNSCAQIWIETRDLDDEQAAMLKELEGLFTSFSSGNSKKA